MPNLPQSGLRGGRGVRAVGVATLNANSVKKQRINAKNELIGVELRTPG